MTDMTIKCDTCGELMKAVSKDVGKSGVCPTCGAPIRIEPGAERQPHAAEIPPPPPVPTVNPPIQGPAPTNGYAIASLVLGILSIVPGVYIGGLIMGTLAIVFSKMATTRIKAAAGSLNGQGLATAGLVTGIVGLSLSVLVILFFICVAGIGLAFFATLFKAMASGAVH